jgi:hypothetical protein
MPWYKVEPNHWQNHNDKHLIWDKETKTLSTEDWSTSPISVVVVPMKVLEEFLPDNRYYIIPEAQYLSSMRAVNAILDYNHDLVGENAALEEENKEGFKARQEIISSYRSVIRHRDINKDALDKAFLLLEADSHEIFKLKSQNNHLNKTVKDLQETNKKIFEIANKEIQRLKELVENQSKQ